MQFNTYDGRTLSLTEKEFKRLYWNECLSIRQIAKKLNICASTLQKPLAENRFPGRKGARRILKKPEKYVLVHILKKLKKEGFNPRLNKAFNKGTKTSDGYCRAKDLWTVALYTRNEIKRLLQETPFHHDEKLRKAKIVLSAGSLEKWEDVSEKAISLRNQIKDEVKISVSKAVGQWVLKQGGFW